MNWTWGDFLIGLFLAIVIFALYKHHRQEVTKARNAGYTEAFRYFIRGRKIQYDKSKIRFMTNQLLLFQTDEPKARARAGDPQTSWAAADALLPEELTGLQAEILMALYENGSGTHEEIARWVGRNPYLSTTRTRVAELRDMGLVKETPERRPTLSTHQDCSIVWRAANSEELAELISTTIEKLSTLTESVIA